MQVDRQKFKQDGYLLIPGLYRREEVATWKQRTVERMRAEGSIDEPSGVRVWLSGQLDDYDRNKVQDPRVEEVLSQLIGPDVEFLSVKAVFKNRAATFGSPWHQDWHYWHGATKTSIWIALDDASPENGCLKVMPGSHLSVVEMRGDDSDAPGFGSRSDEKDLPDFPIVSLPASAGDGVVFSDLLLHSSHPNQSGEDRWAYISTYRDASVRDESTLWSESIVLRGQSVNV
jgi:hypothetical protein